MFVSRYLILIVINYMMLCRKLLQAVRSYPFLTRLIGYEYKIGDILKRGRSETITKIYSPALHLFIQKILQQKQFKESDAVTILMETQKVHVDRALIQKLVKYMVENRQNIVSIQSVSNILTTMYQIGYQNKEDIIKIGFSLFALKENNESSLIKKSFSIDMIRGIISLHLLIGLKSFPAQTINNIKVESFKPLFLFLFLEILHKEGLQDIKMFEQIIDVIVQYSIFIPFSDLTNLRDLKRMENKRLTKLIQYQQRKFRKNLKQQDPNLSNEEINGESIRQQGPNREIQIKKNANKPDFDQKIIQRVYENYLDDLSKKYL